MSHPALMMVKEMSKAIPNVWDMAESFHKDKGKELPEWDDKCYIPIHATLSITQKTFGNTICAALIAALAPWRLSKEVYRFDPDLEQVLYNQADVDMSIPCGVLDRLPFRCVYVESPGLGENIHGFFVHFEHDIVKKRMELRLITIPKDDISIDSGWTPLILCLDKGTIKESFTTWYDESLTNLALFEGDISIPTKEIRETLAASIGVYTIIISRALQLILYVCAQNAEIHETPLRTPRSSRIVDHGKEIRRWDVGLRIGRIIRASKGPAITQGERVAIAGTGKRPHPRRGHWHHYWTGPRSEPSRRELVLRWVAPTFIGSQDDAPVTINIINDNK